MENKFEISYYYVGREYRELIDRVFAVAYGYLGQRGELSLEISFAGRKKIREINASTRGIDKVTDVLSFPSFDLEEGQIVVVNDSIFVADVEEDGTLFLGDIVVCRSVAKAQAEEYGHSLEPGLGFLCLHGLLHLLGYDHVNGGLEEVRMREKEEQVLVKLGLPRTIAYTPE